MNRRASPRLLTVIGAALLLVTIVSILTYFRTTPTRTWRSAIPEKHHSEERPAPAETSTAWEFEVERDAENYGLTDEQCRNAFPLLYGDIEQSLASRSGKPITLEELDARPIVDGMVRGMIYDGDVNPSIPSL